MSERCFSDIFYGIFILIFVIYIVLEFTWSPKRLEKGLRKPALKILIYDPDWVPGYI